MILSHHFGGSGGCRGRPSHPRGSIPTAAHPYNVGETIANYATVTLNSTKYA